MVKFLWDKIQTIEVEFFLFFYERSISKFNSKFIFFPRMKSINERMTYPNNMNLDESRHSIQIHNRDTIFASF